MHNKQRVVWIVGLALVLALAACSGRPESTAGLRVSEAWARPGLAGGNTAVYFVLENSTGEPVSLIGAQCAAAGMSELHKSSMDANGTMQMQRQDAVPVPAGETVRFEPGGLHVMLMNLQQDLKPGDTIQVTLTVQDGDPIALEAPVREPE